MKHMTEYESKTAYFNLCVKGDTLPASCPGRITSGERIPVPTEEVVDWNLRAGQV
jgi:hypothetical protein